MTFPTNRKQIAIPIWDFFNGYFCCSRFPPNAWSSFCGLKMFCITSLNLQVLNVGKFNGNDPFHH